jgi:hypothetical protein
MVTIQESKFDRITGTAKSRRLSSWMISDVLIRTEGICGIIRNTTNKFFTIGNNSLSQKEKIIPSRPPIHADTPTLEL